jgi:hypothetical protein
MKKILLIGDSIRLGYDDYVKESMKNVAEVYYPAENCQSAAVVLTTLHAWADGLGLYEADAVHFNAGHWDNLRIYGDEPIMSIEAYAVNIRRIAQRIRFLFPDAKIIFATTTPVYEAGFIEEFVARRNSDIEAYNAAACEALADLDVTINDLYSLMKDQPVDCFSDRTHFYTAKATELLGGQVTRTLCDALALETSLLTPPDAQKYHKPEGLFTDIAAVEKKGHIYVQKQR